MPAARPPAVDFPFITPMSDGQSRDSGGAPAPGDVTGLLVAWRNGDRGALEHLIPLVYDELHRIAENQLRRERQGHTLQPSAIVHETYLKLVDRPTPNWQGRVHFFAVAARAMRQVLVDYARRRAAQKRGGGAALSMLETELASRPREVDVMAVDEALKKLAGLDPVQAQLVELRFFGGLTVDEAAAALQISNATVHRKWVVARAWLHRELVGDTR
jgi:RNA polymerase sigma factor (TIGR02999 family)